MVGSCVFIYRCSSWRHSGEPWKPEARFDSSCNDQWTLWECKGRNGEWAGACSLRRGKMATAWAQQFYSSTHWQKCRDGFIAYKRGLCERCLAKGIIKAGRDVHHKIHLTPQNITDPAIALSWDNLELLCKECHEEEHREKDWKKMQQQKKAKRQAKRQSKRRYDVDSFGRVKAKTEEETTRA